jgi:hypothetical protein
VAKIDKRGVPNLSHYLTLAITPLDMPVAPFICLIRFDFKRISIGVVIYSIFTVMSAHGFS